MQNWLKTISYRIIFDFRSTLMLFNEALEWFLKIKLIVIFYWIDFKFFV